jgi:hypothetical protein
MMLTEDTEARILPVNKAYYCLQNIFWPKQIHQNKIRLYKSKRKETNWMHYLSLIYSVIIPLYVSGLLFTHHQETTMYVCNKSCVLYNLSQMSVGLLGMEPCPLTVN